MIDTPGGRRPAAPVQDEGLHAAGSGVGGRPPYATATGALSARPVTDLLYVVAAAVLAVALSHMPFLDVVIYPFKLFSVYAHEWSHALVTIATGGHVVALRINPDLSGEEYRTGGWGLAISSAGYLGAASAGALLLLAPLRRAKRTLVAIGATVAALPIAGTLLQGATFTLTTWFWTVVFAAVTLAVGRRGTRCLAGLFQQFLAVELCLTALDSLRSLDWLAINAPGVMTDATNAGGATHLPAIVWAALWSVIGVAIVGLAGLRLVRRSLRART